jgi:hypothetical protein
MIAKGSLNKMYKIKWNYNHRVIQEFIHKLLLKSILINWTKNEKNK